MTSIVEEKGNNSLRSSFSADDLVALSSKSAGHLWAWKLGSPVTLEIFYKILKRKYSDSKDAHYLSPGDKKNPFSVKVFSYKKNPNLFVFEFTPSKTYIAFTKSEAETLIRRMELDLELTGLIR